MQGKSIADAACAIGARSDFVPASAATFAAYSAKVSRWLPGICSACSGSCLCEIEPSLNGSNIVCNASALRCNIHWFETLAEAQRLIEAWKIDCNESRPHMALGNKTPTEYFLQVIPSTSAQGKRPLKTNAGYGPPFPSASPDPQLT